MGQRAAKSRHQPHRRAATNALLPALIVALLGACSFDVAGKSLHPDYRLLRGEVLAYGDWVVGCDNLRVCTAIAPMGAASQGEEIVYVQMTFTVAISDPQSVFLAGSDAIENLSPLDAHMLFEGLLDGAQGSLAFAGENGAIYPVPRDGFVAAMQALGRWRKIARLHPVRVIAPTLVPLQRWEVPVVPVDLAGAYTLCPEGHMGNSLQAWTAVDKSILWRVGCGDEGLNPQSVWYLQRSANDAPALLSFEDRFASITPYNSWYEEASGLIHITQYYGGQFTTGFDDCGVYRAYAWTTKGAVLVERREFPRCGLGLLPDEWITTYRAAY